MERQVNGWMVDMIICYTDANRAINLRWRDENKVRQEKTIEDFEPYFFINNLETEYNSYTISTSIGGKRVKLTYPFKYETGDWRSLQGTLLKKVKVLKAGDVKTARKMWRNTYEADVPFHYRYCIDNVNEVTNTNLRKWYWDMEWINKDPEHGDAITAIVVYDNYTEKFTTLTWLPNESSEKEMLEQFINLIQTQDPDMLISWFGSFADLPKLIERLDYNDIDPRGLSPYNDVKGCSFGKVSKYIHNYSQIEQPIRGRITLDLNVAFERQWTDSQRGTLPSLALDYVSELVLGQKKLVSEKFPDKNEFFRRGWLEDRETYLEYALIDVDLIKRLDDEMGLSDGILALQSLLNAPFDACFYVTNMATIYFMRNANWIAPTGDKSMIKEKYEGAMIYNPLQNKTNGLHIGVAAFDFAGLYPSMMLSRNISFETKSAKPTEFACNLATPRDFSITDEKKMVYYKTDKLGLLPRSVLELKTLRDEYKRKMKKAKADGNKKEYTKWFNNQMAAKRLMASFYGVIAKQGFGWSDVQLAASITASAREAIRTAAFKVQEME